MAVSWIHKHDDNGDEVCCCPECDAVQADPKLTYCTVCGYDLVRQTKVDVSTPRPPT